MPTYIEDGVNATKVHVHFAMIDNPVKYKSLPAIIQDENIQFASIPIGRNTYGIVFQQRLGFIDFSETASVSP